MNKQIIAELIEDFAFLTFNEKFTSKPDPDKAEVLNELSEYLEPKYIELLESTATLKSLSTLAKGYRYLSFNKEIKFFLGLVK